MLLKLWLISLMQLAITVMKRTKSMLFSLMWIGNHISGHIGNVRAESRYWAWKHNLPATVDLYRCTEEVSQFCPFKHRLVKCIHTTQNSCQFLHFSERAKHPNLTHDKCKHVSKWSNYPAFWKTAIATSNELHKKICLCLEACASAGRKWSCQHQKDPFHTKSFSMLKRSRIRTGRRPPGINAPRRFWRPAPKVHPCQRRQARPRFLEMR